MKEVLRTYKSFAVVSQNNKYYLCWCCPADKPFPKWIFEEAEACISVEINECEVLLLLSKFSLSAAYNILIDKLLKMKVNLNKLSERSVKYLCFDIIVKEFESNAALNRKISEKYKQDVLSWLVAEAAKNNCLVLSVGNYNIVVHKWCELDRVSVITRNNKLVPFSKYFSSNKRFLKFVENIIDNIKP